MQSIAGTTEGRMNHHELYKLDCCYCSHTIHTIALPAGLAERELVACPRCGGMLEVRWREGRVNQRGAQSQQQ